MNTMRTLIARRTHVVRAALPLLLVLSLMSPSADAQTPHLVKDINSFANSSSPSALVNVGNQLAFEAWDGTAYRLWRSDGTEAGTTALAEVPGGSPNSTGYAASAAGLAFIAIDQTPDSQLWRTDATPAGTFSVAPAFMSPGNMTGSPNLLFFEGSDADHGRELWTTDGSASGTGLVKDLNPGPTGSLTYPGPPCFANGRLFFAADDGGYNGLRPYSSDGTAAGTVLLTNLADSGDPALFTAVGNEVYFVEQVNEDLFNLWRTDGTPGGTVLVRSCPNLSPARLLTAVGNRLFFYTSRQLWVSDGTEAGTRFVADLPEGWLSISKKLTALKGQLFFMLKNSDATYDLWRSDGTAGGTHRIVRFGHPPAYIGSTPVLMPAAGRLYFEGWDHTHGVELWKTDGTTEGTRMVADIVPGSGSSFPEALHLLGDTLFFRATTPQTGAELWAMTVPGAGDPRQVSVTIQSSNSLNPYGSLVTITITVQALAGTPTGTVTLKDMFDELATLPLVASGPTAATAAYTTTTFDIGDHPLIAQYSGDGNHDAGQSLPTIQTIVPAPTTASLAASPNPADAGQTVTLTATVTTGLTTSAQGTITFRDAATGVIGTATLDATGSAALSVPQLSGGTHFLSAEYSGEDRFKPSTSQVYRLGVGGSAACPAFTSLGDYDSLPGVGWEDHPLVYAVDLDRDGRADIVLGGQEGSAVVIAKADPDGRLQPWGSQGVSSFEDVVFGDFGGDNALDVGVASGSGLVVLVDEGDQFRAVWNATLPGSVTASTAGDFNHDGKLDIAVVDTYNTRIAFGNGNAAFTYGPQFPTGADVPSGGIAAADLNGDGITDLVLPDWAGGRVAIVLGEGDGKFGAPAYVDIGGARAHSVTAADLNQDGHPDLVAVGTTNRDAVVLLGNGDGTFQTAAHYPFGQPSVTPGQALIGDLDGDAVPDLVSVPDGTEPGNVEIRLGNGDGTFGAPQQVASYQYVSVAALGDVNGDGKLDLVVRGGNGYPLDVLLNACGPLPTNTSMAATPTQVAIGQRVDLVVTVTSASGRPAGRVTFRDAGAMVAQANIGPHGRVQITLSTLSAGTHSLTARYNGSGDYWPSESAPVTVTVQTGGSPPAPATSCGRATSRALPVGTATTGSLAAAQLEGAEAKPDAAGIPILSPVGLALLLLLIALTGVLVLRQKTSV